MAHMSEMDQLSCDERWSDGTTALFEEPFPQRGAVQALRDRVLLFLQRKQLAPGSPFLNDADLANRAGLSRSTVRRALDPLHREGWLSREAGRGTFVGPKVLGGAGREVGARTKNLRLGVILFDIGGLAHDWVTPRVMAGLDQAADSVGLNVELLGLRHEDVASLVRRLERSRPDVLASLAAQPRDALLLRDAVRLNIPTLVVGTAHQFLGMPAVVEDNVQGMNLAMDLLRKAGHKRIGLLINRWPSPWVFQRQEAFEKRMLLEGLDPNLIGTCWIGSANHPGYHSEPDGLSTRPRRSLMGGSAFSETLPLEGADKTVIRWLKQTQPTAIVTASYVAMEALGQAIGQLGISIPRDLSVVGLDQHPLASQWLGVEPTLAELPLEAIGRQVAHTSRALAEGAELPEVVRVPFQVRQGLSITVAEGHASLRSSVTG